ncbi:MAG: hypothetical protein KDD50_03890, partial [Bdellovibrionales bacterium]|nr:hypothetical protein [Bdellovibrionales bacterium]
MKIGYLIFLVFYGLPLFASEFSSFQVDEVKLQQLYQKQDKVKELPKGLVFSQGIVPVSNSPQDIQFEKSPLYEQVMEYMEKYHQEIGQELIGNTLNRSKDFNLGVKNMSGFTWQKPLGVVSVIADRQVIPSTTNSKWEVHDLILFSVNAKTFLESLSDQGAIRIEQAQLKAFAGLSFNRQYEYIHSVSSYEEGISLDSSKLFLSPAVFHGALYQAMWPGDSISKKDYFSIHAGGAVHLPIYKGLDLSAAVLGGVEKISETKLSLNETNSSVYRDFDLILKFNNKTNAFFGAEANLALDFFNLLKITLLKFEYQFSYEKSLTSVYRFPVSELIQYELNGIEHKKLIGAVNSNSIEDEFVARHLDHYEESRLKTHDFDFYFFLWGINSTSSEEELIWRSKDKESHFYSSQREKSSHTKTLKGSVTGVLSLSILGVDLFKDYKKSTTHAYDLNYTNVDENKISTLTFRKEYYLQKTNGWG